MKNWTGPIRSTAFPRRELGLPVDDRLAELRDADRLFLVRGEDGSVREMALRAADVEIDAETKAIEITASDETVDRYGDVIVAAGWQLENYMRNPVILIDHSYRVASIVGSGEPRIKGKKLRLKITHDPDEQNVSARMVDRLITGGFLRANSVGFMPLEWEVIHNKDGNVTGYRFTKQDLLEDSWVAVPANPNATLGAEIDRLIAPTKTTDTLRELEVARARLLLSCL